MATAADRLDHVHAVMSAADPDDDSFSQFLAAFGFSTVADREAFVAFVGSLAAYLSEAILADDDVAGDGLRATTALVMAGFHAGALYAARLELDRV